MLDIAAFKSKIAEFTGRPAADLSDQTVLIELISESFALVEMMIELQEEFRVRFVAQDDLREVKTVGDLIRIFQRHADMALEKA